VGLTTDRLVPVERACGAQRIGGFVGPSVMWKIGKEKYPSPLSGSEPRSLGLPAPVLVNIATAISSQSMRVTVAISTHARTHTHTLLLFIMFQFNKHLRQANVKLIKKNFNSKCMLNSLKIKRLCTISGVHKSRAPGHTGD
jgi:hypothetical protein